MIVLALPVFAIAGWPLKGWALTAVLWTAAQALGYLLTRLPLDQGNLAASGVRGIGMGFRAFIVGIPLVAVTVADSQVGVAAAIVSVTPADAVLALLGGVFVCLLLGLTAVMILAPFFLLEIGRAHV